MSMDFAESDSFLKDFKFSSGELFPELKLHYRTLGSPRFTSSGQITNAVLMLHGTTGSGKQFTAPETADFLFRAGQPLDGSQYFIILPDAIGHGGSSKPSDGLRARYPRYTYTDIVEAQYRLVRETLKISKLRLILGTSMGGMQTWMWGERYPDMMEALLPIACFPDRVSGRNLLWRRMLINFILQDPAYEDGNYRQQPPSVGMAWSLFELMVDSPTHLKDAFKSVEDADNRVKQVREAALKEQDANNVLYEFESSQDYDPSDGIKKINAPLLTVNFADDSLNPAELAVADAAVKQMKNARSVLIPVSGMTRGHQTLRWAKVWGKYVNDLLKQTEAK